MVSLKPLTSYPELFERTLRMVIKLRLLALRGGSFQRLDVERVDAEMLGDRAWRLRLVVNDMAATAFISDEQIENGAMIEMVDELIKAAWPLEMVAPK